jgi:hypothetical protein
VPITLPVSDGDGEAQFSENPLWVTHIGVSVPLTTPFASVSKKYQSPPEENIREADLL